MQGRARIKAYGEKCRAYEIKANSQITIAYGTFKEMKIDDRSAFVLQKYQDASSGYAQVQGEFKYKISSIGVLLQNSIMAAMFAVLAVILPEQTWLRYLRRWWSILRRWSACCRWRMRF